MAKKGEKPEDHIMKVEDYFQNYKITDQKKMCDRFRDTCCGKAHTWLSTLTTYPNIFDPEAAPDEEAKAKTMKNVFLAHWQLKDRTLQALYMEWQNLKFDPAKDDIEDFCNDVKNLANRLGYPEEAQVMAIKSNIPPVLVTQVINITTFREIRDTLITLVENPVIKRVLMTEGTGEKGLAPFNMSHAQWRPENDAGIDAGLDSGITSASSNCGAESSSNFEEHIEVTTTYLGRYLAQGGPRTFNSENAISLDGKGITTRHLFDKTEVKVFYDLGASKSYMSKQNTRTIYQN